MKKKIIVAYSGGLDTSVMVKWLKSKYDAEIIAVTGNLGQDEDWEALEKKAIMTGASKLYVYDLKEDFIENYAWTALKAGALYEDEYPLSTAIGRPLLVKKLVETAIKENTNIISHGCTAKGNDQIRFEVGLKTLMPDVNIIAPLRDWEFKTREDEIDYAIENNIPISITKEKPYSIDANLWGSATECGELEETTNMPPEDAFQITNPLNKTPDSPSVIEIEFEKGIPVKLNNEKYSASEIVTFLNQVAGQHGIGRMDIVENRIVGIKSREIYEAPAAVVLHFAHKQIEKLTLDKDTYRFKESISSKISNLIYDGLWFSPLFNSLKVFVDSTQKYVSGKIKLQFFKGNITIISRESKYSLYDKSLATYSEGDTFNHQSSSGFINLTALPFQIMSTIRNEEENYVVEK